MRGLGVTSCGFDDLECRVAMLTVVVWAASARTSEVDREITHTSSRTSHTVEKWPQLLCVTQM